jgi:hypothetical protein
MIWDILIAVFVLLALGAAFGAVPLSAIWRVREAGRLRRRRPIVLRQDRTPAKDPHGRNPGVRVIPFPAAGIVSADAKTTAAGEARRA